MKVLLLLKAARPKTLIASVSPVIAGTAAASCMSSINFLLFLCTLFSAVLLQIASNFFNDAIDFEKGADTSERFGPQRVTQAGLLSSSEVKWAAFCCVFLAILLGIPLVIQGGLPIVIIGLSAAFFSWAYTGGPYPLSYNGLGEVFVLIYYGIIAVCGTYYLQTLSWDLLLTAPIGVAVGSFGMALIGVNNFRDIYQDRKAGKKTLAVRFGETASKYSIIFFLIAPYLILIFYLLILTNDIRSLLLAGPFLGSFYLSFIIIKLLWKATPSKEVNRLLGLISLNQLFFTISFIAVGSITVIYLFSAQFIFTKLF